MPVPPARPRRALLESLEARQLYAITPGHLALATRSVDEVLPENNVYVNGPFSVTWAGLNGATTTSVSADCTTYVTALLKAAYKFTNNDFVGMFGVSSPSLNTYFDSAVADDALDGFKEIANARPGDLFICDYPDGSSARGHMVMLDGLPQLVSTGTQYKAYTARIIDVTSAVHSDDTRYKANADGTNDSGVGRSTIRLYTDLAGNLSHWAWGKYTTSTTYNPDTFPVTFAKVPYKSMNSPTAFKAVVNSETSVTVSWADNSGVEDGYVIQRSGDNGVTWADVGDVNASVTSFTDTAVTPGGYRYRVWGQVANNQSASAAGGGVTVNAIVPAAPTAFTATSSTGHVRLQWQDNAANELRYVVERSIDGGAYATLASVGAGSVSYLDWTASVGRTYQYRLRAEAAFANSLTLTSDQVNRATRTGVWTGVTPIGGLPTPVAVPRPATVASDLLK